MKPFFDQFENRIWCLLYDMGFSEMNRDNSFVIKYSDAGSTEQIDVFAYDGEIALIVECKASETPGKRIDFKTEIEALGGRKSGIIQSVKKKYGRDVKIKFVWAVSNIILGDEDKARLDNFDVEVFDDEAIEYYSGLALHLGSTAKYQLLGKLFANQDIKNMNNKVPAIRGKMGGHTYYSFSIEPERLLKIGYVLHRNDANRNMMPTYQRVIKKTRLKSVRDFIDDGGYFPNSIIISIDTQKGLQFDFKHGEGDDIAKLGILHLPQKYCSAYIIDGQHRLYGYSDSIYSKSNTIPVVAFENLEKEEQIKLFMEINENQKAVPKNLRNTLSSDLLWTSDIYSERRKALRLRIAEELGENQASPLFGHVLIGENKKTSLRCVTMDSIEKGLKAGNLLTSFNKNNQPLNNVIGLFDNAEASNEPAFRKLTPFLFEAFEYFKTELPEEWALGEDQEGILTNNVAIDAFLRIFSDTIDFYQTRGLILPYTQDPKQIVDKCKRFFEIIVDFYKTMDSDTRSEIRHQLGGNGPIKHWRHLQKAIYEKVEEFNPEGFENYWADNSKQYNSESLEKLGKIIESTKRKVYTFMTEQKGEDWISFALPVQIDDNLNALAVQKNNERKRNGQKPLTVWEYANLETCLAIANSGSNWSSGLNDILTEPAERSKRGTKASKTQWMSDLSNIESNLSKPGYSVSQSNYHYICSVFQWVTDKEKMD